MKKNLVVVLALLMGFMFVTAAIAQTWGEGEKEKFMQKMGAAKEMTVSGDVTSHDVMCHCIVVKGAKTVILQDDYAEFQGDYNRAKGLAVGSKVKVTYKAVGSINYATKVENVK